MNESTELLTRVLCDSRLGFPSDGVYLYCQTESSQQSVFQSALSITKHFRTSNVLILDSPSKSGFPGFAKWKEELLKLGLENKQIKGVEPGKHSTINTLIESQALIKFALQQGYKSLLIVAPPFQQLRAFMTAVTVAMQEYPILQLYSTPTVAMPWQEQVTHSQGTLTAKRSELIHAELKRIDTYQKKGDLATFAQVISYLNKRNTIT